MNCQCITGFLNSVLFPSAGYASSDLIIVEAGDAGQSEIHIIFTSTESVDGGALDATTNMFTTPSEHQLPECFRAGDKIGEQTRPKCRTVPNRIA
jgi:hypothetical protein